MLKVGAGSIVNLCSVAGLIANAGPPPYTASKGGVRLLTKAGALVYAVDKIRLNSVHPDAIWTPIFKPTVDLGKTKEELNSLFPTPMNIFGKAKKIAYGILFLISDESSFMTGSELVIDGGLTAS